MTREDEIFEQLKSGNRDAVEELVQLYYGEILVYCRYHVPDPGMAEDAVQETFLKVFRYLDRYRHKGKFRAFLYQVAANTCVDLCRKTRSNGLLPEISYRDKGLGEEEDKEDFLLLLSCLPDDLREIVFLRFSQELKLREIGQVLNLPLRTVQSRLRKALKLLEKEMEERRWNMNE